MSNDNLTSAQQILADARRAALGADTSPQPAFNAARGWVDVGDKPASDQGDFMRSLGNYLPQMREMGNAVQTMAGVGAKKLGFDDMGNAMIEDGLAGMSAAKAKTVAKDTDSFTGAWDQGMSAVIQDWLPYQLGQAVGNVGEGLIGAVGGAVVGAALSGPAAPAGAAGGLVGGILFRSLLKKGVIEQAEQMALSQGEVAARNFLKKQAASLAGTNAAIATQAIYHGFGETGSRVLEEAQKNGMPLDQIDLGRYALSAAGHTTLEFIGDKIMLGGVLGKGAYRAAGQGALPLAKTVVGNMAKMGIKEAPVEVGQTALERTAADLPLTNAEAQREYVDAAAAAGAMGITGAPGGVRSYLAGEQAANPTPPPVNPLIDQLAAANGPLSRATVAANPDLKQAPPVEPPTNPLDQRAVDLSNLLRDSPLLAHLQSTGQTDVASDLLGALAFAKNPQLSNQARQQAVNYLTEQIGQMQAAIMPADQEQDTTLAGADMADAAIDSIADVAQQPALVQSSPPTPEVVTPFTTPNPELVQIETQNATENIAVQAANTPATAENITEKSAARTTVQAPKVATPPGTGTAQARQRKVQLQAMAADGFDTVERQPDGGFSLINPRRNEALALTGMGDAQLARKAVADYMDNAANQAASSAQNKLAPPTDKQIVAENYKKGHLTINGMDVSIENPRHTTRSGTSPEGKRWSNQMAHHYGYLKKTEGADGDAVDVFIGSRPDSDKVFVIDQNHADGSFDEHKVMMGFANEETARAGYLANYDKGWTGLGAITPMTVPQFKTWVKSSAARQPAAGYDANSTQGNAHDGRGIEAAGNAAARLAGGHLEGSNSQSGAGDQGSEFGQVHGAVPRSDAAREGGPGRDSQDGGGASQKNRSGLAGHAGAAGQTADTQGVVEHSGRRDGDGAAQHNNDGLAQGREIFARHKNQLEQRLASASSAEEAAILRGEIARLPLLNAPPAAELSAFSALSNAWSNQFGDAAVGYWDTRAGASDGVSAGDLNFINLVNPSMNVLWTIGHEFEHLSERMAVNEGDTAMARLRDYIWSLISDSGRKAYYENYLHAGDKLKLKDATPQQLKHLKQEMLADFMGKRFTDKAWLQNLADTKPALFGAFIKEWLSMLTGLIRSLRGAVGLNQDSPKNVDKYIADLQQAKALATELAIAWAERHPKLAEQTGVDEILHSRTDPYAEYEFGQDDESFDDFDMDSMDLQAEMEAEQAQTQDRLSPPQLDVTDAEIKVAGLMAEEAFPDLAWRADPDARGMQQEAEIVGLYQPGITYQVAMNLDRSGLWSVDLRGTWVGPAMNESDGYATEAAVKLFTKRQIAAIDLKEREFDLASTSGKALQKRLVEGWKSIQHASARKFGRLGRTARSLKEVADDMGLLKQYEVTIHREILDAHSSVQNVTFKHKEKSISGSALLTQHEAGGKKFLSANTAEMGKSGLGAAFYQMAAEYAARHNMTLRPDAFLSGINSYRRTEQMLSAALRTGKSNVMVPHPVQRVYGFEDDASRAEQHQANLARLILAGVRNARELVPGFDELRYNPSTKTFTDTAGQPKDDEVEQMLKEVDARAFGMGRGTLARSVLSHMVMLDEIKLNSDLVFAEPVLYSERVRDEVQSDPSQTNIVYEVAPDPNNAAVSQAWNQLTAEQRLAASEAVTHVITPQVLAALGASGKQVTQIGSYLDDTNTSFALTLDQGDALSVSHALGYVLSQDSMVVLSEQPFRGGDATGSVHIRVGDKSAAEIDAIYQQLRAIQADGEQPIGGQSTANGVMVVLNFSNINNDELGQLIDAKLAGAYDVSGHDIYAAFPQKEDYNYDLQKSNPRGNQSLLWQALNPLRSEAASLIGRYIDKHSGRDAGDGSGRLAGGRASDSQGTAQQSEIARRGTGQSKSHPAELTPLPGAPNVPGFHGPDPQLVQVARQYARDNGITLHRQAEYVEIDKDRATRIAKAYADMPHAPQDPVVKEAFYNLIKQTTAQYQSLVDAGYKFWFFDLDKPDNLKYISTPWNAMRDIRANKEMGVFSTEDGFGNGDATRDNPLETTVMDFTWPSGGLNGPQKKVLANDLFRAVHDAFGHGLEGAGFRAQGEENAWQAHIRLFTGSAIGAITSETRGQNSWVNFGPHADSNHAAKAEDTVFADQKTGLMPAWTWTEGVAGDADIQHSARTPMFYSELTRQVEQSSMKQAPAGAWKSHIKALAQKGVKADEIEWSGVNEWLDLQEGKVSRQALTDYLDANGVQVQETVLGATDPDIADVLRFHKIDDSEWSDLSRGERAAKIEEYENSIGNGETKYSQYQLPGGTNYREVLLTLPKAEERVPLPQLQKRRQVLVELKDDYLAARNKGLTQVTPQSVLDADIALATQAIEAVMVDIAAGHYKQMTVPIGPMPHVLRMLRAPAQMLKIDTGIIRKILIDKHSEDFTGVSAREFVMAMYRPALVLKGDATGEYELVSHLVTPNGPVMFAIKQDAELPGTGVKVGVVMSAYAKAVAGNGNTLAKRIMSGRLLYADMLTAQTAITGNEVGQLESTDDGHNSTDLVQSRTSERTLPASEQLVKPLNSRYAGWRVLKEAIVGGIAERKVKDDLTLLGWIGKNYNPKTSEKGWEDAPAFSKRAGPREQKYEHNYLVPEMDGAFDDDTGNIAQMPEIRFQADGISRTLPAMPVRIRVGEHEREGDGLTSQYGLQHRIENQQNHPNRQYMTPGLGDGSAAEVERATRDIAAGVLGAKTAYADGAQDKIYIHAPGQNRQTVLQVKTDAKGEKFWSVVTSFPATREQMMRRYKSPTSITGIPLDGDRSQQPVAIARGILSKLQEPGLFPNTSESYILDEDNRLYSDLSAT